MPVTHALRGMRVQWHTIGRRPYGLVTSDVRSRGLRVARQLTCLLAWEAFSCVHKMAGDSLSNVLCVSRHTFLPTTRPYDDIAVHQGVVLWG